jgi:hypothetical protein
MGLVIHLTQPSWWRMIWSAGVQTRRAGCAEAWLCVGMPPAAARLHSLTVGCRAEGEDAEDAENGEQQQGDDE